MARHAGKSRQWAYEAFRAVSRNEADMEDILTHKKIVRKPWAIKKGGKSRLIYKFKVNGKNVEYDAPTLARIVGVTTSTARYRLRRVQTGKMKVENLLDPPSKVHIRKKLKRPKAIVEKTDTDMKRSLRLLESFNKGEINMNEYLRLA